MSPDLDLVPQPPYRPGWDDVVGGALIIALMWLGLLAAPLMDELLRAVAP